jgi:hypothetical protein
MGLSNLLTLKALLQKNLNTKMHFVVLVLYRGDCSSDKEFENAASCTVAFRTWSLFIYGDKKELWKEQGLH